MSQFYALLTKELKEALRDKRALMMALAIAVMAPIMIFALSNILIKESVETPDVYVDIVGAEFSPKLIAHLDRNNIYPLQAAKQNDKAFWQEKSISLTIPQSFNKQMQASETISIVLRADYSDKALLAPIRRIYNAVNQYSRTIGYQRLLMRGIDVGLLQPMKVIEQDIAQPNSNAMIISMMLGLYLLMAAFMTGLPVAIDASAGERERNVLEILLCQPVHTLKIVLAKLSCASIIAIVGVVLTLLLTLVAVSFVDLTQIGSTFHLNFFTIVTLLFLLIPVCIFASALQLFVAFHAKNFKEAQSMVSLIILLPALLPTVIMFIDDRPYWLNFLPITGQSLLMEALFKNIPVSGVFLIFTTIVTLVITCFLIFLIAKKLKSEKVILALS